MHMLLMFILRYRSKRTSVMGCCKVIALLFLTLTMVHKINLISLVKAVLFEPHCFLFFLMSSHGDFAHQGDLLPIFSLTIYGQILTYPAVLSFQMPGLKVAMNSIRLFQNLPLFQEHILIIIVQVLCIHKKFATYTGHALHQLLLQ